MSEQSWPKGFENSGLHRKRHWKRRTLPCAFGGKMELKILVGPRAILLLDAILGKSTFGVFMRVGWDL